MDQQKWRQKAYDEEVGRRTGARSNMDQSRGADARRAADISARTGSSYQSGSGSSYQSPNVAAPRGGPGPTSREGGPPARGGASRSGGYAAPSGKSSGLSWVLLLVGGFIGYGYGVGDGNAVLYAILGGLVGLLIPSALALAFKLVKVLVIAALVIGGVAFLINLGGESTKTRDNTDARARVAEMLSKIEKSEQAGAPSAATDKLRRRVLERAVLPANGPSTTPTSDSSTPIAEGVPVTLASPTRSDMRAFQSAMEQVAAIIFNMKCNPGGAVYSYDARPLTVARNDGGFDISLGEEVSVGSTFGWRAGLEQLDLSTPEISGPIGDCMQVNVRCRIGRCVTRSGGLIKPLPGEGPPRGSDQLTIYTKGATQANELINALRRAQGALGQQIN